MKQFSTALLLAAALTVPFAASRPAQAATTCLETRDIVSAQSDDGKIMQFKMRDGQTYINHLQGICSDLRFNGFVWTVRDTNRVCENSQSLRVLRSGQICVLGKFDPPTAARAPG